MKLFFRHMGQGNPVIILHGLLGLSDNWVSFGRQLSTDFEIFIPDLRNHGQSPHDPVFNFPSLVKDLLDFINDLGLKRLNLIGHSLGGKTAMSFALEYPDRINKLVVVDIAPRKYPSNLEHELLIDAMLKVDLTLAHSRSDIEKQLEPNVHSSRLRQFLLKSVYWKDKQSLGWRINLPVLKDSLPFIMEEISPNKKLQNPVLFVRGGQSDYITDNDVPEILRLFPLCTIKTLENASHWVHADVPFEFYSVVHDFLIS
ncbi:MAG: alpha/beta fold hydrolase [Bacteroidales bacterium]|jgi:pimeloyl-ACP methyl ester carboxylesterase